MDFSNPLSRAMENALPQVEMRRVIRREGAIWVLIPEEGKVEIYHLHETQDVEFERRNG